jgi:choline kinase
LSHNQHSAHAVILAAGVGRRLGAQDHPPKIMLEFGGRTLLQRHLGALEACGIQDISITVGYAYEQIEAEVQRLGRSERVRFVHNPRYREGSLVSLWTQSAFFAGGAASAAHGR